MKTSRKLLFFSRSVLFQHPVIARNGLELSFAEKAFVELAKHANCAVDCTKDGGVFERDLNEYAAIVSYSCGKPGDLMKPTSLDCAPPVTEHGYENLRHAVLESLSLLGIHPGIYFLPEAFGADCLGHGSQQTATMIKTSPDFPGLEKISRFSLYEEWFALVPFNDDLHTILLQDCTGMDTSQPQDRKYYARSPFPATWARLHGKGRVFYTSMGHREDVWTSAVFRDVVLAGLAWLLGDTRADVAPNRCLEKRGA